MTRFNAFQQAAIDARGANLLLSASAGSGKTTVLAERIATLVAEGMPLSALLVVTFTRAAAAEMRERIYKALADKGQHAAALSIERADIRTFHGFCTDVCRRSFVEAEIDPAFRVGDDGQMKRLFEEAIDQALTDCFDTPSDDFLTMSLCFDPQNLPEIIHNVYNFLTNDPDPWGALAQWLDALDCTPENAPDSLYAQMLLHGAGLQWGEVLHSITQLLQFAKKHDVLFTFTNERYGEIIALCTQINHSPDAAIAASARTLDSKPRVKKTDDKELHDLYKEMYALIREQFKDAQQLTVQLQYPEKCAIALKKSAVVARGIAYAVGRAHAVYTALKSEQNLLDYSDLEHCALRALEDPAVAHSLQTRYQMILVDEYQDQSSIQEAVLERIRRQDNLFMVGDVKQSIYRFRQADPLLFLAKYTAFSDAEDARDRRIRLTFNYRSHAAILHAVNAVFERTFNGNGMELTYDKEEWLQPAPDAPPGVQPELCVLLTDKDTDENKEEPPDADDALTRAAVHDIECEAVEAARRMKALVQEGYERKDMVVLLRSAKGLAAFVTEVLLQEGITAWSDTPEDAWDRPETKAILAILSVVDRLRQDIPLMAALKGPALGLTDKELAEIRLAQPHGPFYEATLQRAAREDDLGHALTAFFATIQGWAMDAQRLPLSRLIQKVLTDTQYSACCGAMPDGRARQANLRALVASAATFERERAGALSAFLRQIEKHGRGEGLDALATPEGDQRVRVMTVHKAKGLEFPVVFVLGLGTKFRSSSRGDHGVKLHARLGLAPDAIDPMLRTKGETIAQQAIKFKLREENRAEEARILYVAMTRAKERLIMLGTTSQKKQSAWNNAFFPAPIHAQMMLDWLVPIAMKGEVITYQPISPKAPRRQQGTSTRLSQRAHAARLLPLLAPDSAVYQRLTFTPPLLSMTPLKQGATAAIARQLGVADVPFAEREKPHFLTEKRMTASDRGNAVHTFLRALPLTATNAAMAAETMLEREILTPEAHQSLPLDALQSLLGMPLWARFGQATQTRREWSFNYLMGAEPAPTLIQGVMDACFLEEGQWVLIDYKTDRLCARDAFVERHRQQVQLYAKALAALSPYPVKETLLVWINENGMSIHPVSKEE